MKNLSVFVKIIRWENDNFGLTLRKRRFCVAKQPLLPCKTYAFGMQNNRFCNTLVTRWLYNRYACDKYLQIFCLLSVCKTRRAGAVGLDAKGCFPFSKVERRCLSTQTFYCPMICFYLTSSLQEQALVYRER